MKIDVAIQEAIDEGITQPGEIAAWVIEQKPKKWLTDALLEVAHRTITRRAVDYFSHGREGTSRYRPTAFDDIATTAEPGIEGSWYYVPEVGRVPVEDMTVEYCLAAAMHYRKLAQSNIDRAVQLEDWADEMKQRGAMTVGELWTGVAA